MAPPPSTASATGRKPVKKLAAKPSTTKSAAVSKPRSHPTYYEMVKEAVVALKERTGSSQPAIAKFIEEKQKDQLPSNYKKLLSVQLKKLVASGKLTKVKNSYKLSTIEKTVSVKPKKPVGEVKKVVVKKTKSAGDVKEKKPKKVAISASKEKTTKKVSEKAVKKVKKVLSVKSPAKKTKSVKTPLKKPKTIRPPAKKAKK